MSIRGLFAGALMLAGLELVVSTDQSASRFGGLLTSIGAGVRYLLNPTIAAIPDRRPAGGSTATTESATSAGTVEQLSFRHAPTPTVAVQST